MKLSSLMRIKIVQKNLNDEVEDVKIKTDLLGNSEFSVF